MSLIDQMDWHAINKACTCEPTRRYGERCTLGPGGRDGWIRCNGKLAKWQEERAMAARAHLISNKGRYQHAACDDRIRGRNIALVETVGEVECEECKAQIRRMYGSRLATDDINSARTASKREGE